MAKSRNRIQYLLNEYLERNGSIDLLLPDGVEIAIGITQQGKRGVEKMSDYCWVTTTRGNCTTIMDKYSMSMEFDNESQCLVNQSEQGIVTVI